MIPNLAAFPTRLAVAAVVSASGVGVVVDHLVANSTPTTSLSSTSSATTGNNANGGNAPTTSGSCGSSNPLVTYTSAFSKSALGYHVATANVANLLEKNCSGDTITVILSSPTATLGSASTTMGPKDTGATVTFPAPGPLAAEVTLVTVQICNQPNGNGTGKCTTVTP